MIPASPAVARDLRDLTARRRRLGLTVHELARIARLRTGRVCRPDGKALLRLHWAMLRLEDGWSLQQVRQVIEWRLRVDRTPPGTGAWPPSDMLREMPPAVGAPSSVREGGGGRQDATNN